MKRALYALVLCALAVPAASEGPKRTLDVDFGLGFRDNPTNGGREMDRLRDRAFDLSGTLAWHQVVGRDASLSWGGRIEGRAHDEIHGLDRLGAALFVHYAHRLGGAYTSPWIEASYEYGRQIHRDSRLRDGASQLASLGLNARLTDRVKGGVTLEAQHRQSDLARAFDTRLNRVRLGLDYRLGNWDTLFLDASVGRGRFLSSSFGRCNTTYKPGASYDPALWGGGDPATCYTGCHMPPSGCVEDTALPGSADWFAFRVSGLTRDIGLGLSRRLPWNASLNLYLNASETRAENAFRYRGESLTLNYQQRF